MVFDCNYCAATHPDGERSVEHIVPERLGNHSLTLSDACSRWNNLFARSFETPVMRSDFMKMVLVEFGLSDLPPEGAFLGEVQTARGTTERLFRRADGAEFLHDRPRRSKTDVIPLPAVDKDGRYHVVHAKTPFEYFMGTQGGEQELDDIKPILDRQRRRLDAYLRALIADPSIDAGVARELAERGLRLARLKDTGLEYELHVERLSAPQVVDDFLPKQYPWDVERWQKFFLKIGWCFACDYLGRARISALGADAVLEHLKSGLVDPAVVARCRRDAPEAARNLFDEVKLPRGPEWLWAQGLAISDVAPVLATLPESVREEVAAMHRDRVEEHQAVAGWVHVRQAGLLRLQKGGPPATQRRHVLSLHVLRAGGNAILACSISLFGGVAEAVVQLSTPQDPGELGAIERTETIPFSSRNH